MEWSAFNELDAAVTDAFARGAALADADDGQLALLAVRSQDLERAAAEDLTAGDADVRELAALHLAAGAALDLALAADLIERGRPGAALDAAASRYEATREELRVILDVPPGMGVRDVVTEPPPDLATALEQRDPLPALARAADDAIDSIAGNAEAIAGHAVDGLVDLGAEAVLGALGAAAEQLFPRLYARAKRFVKLALRQVMKAVSKLSRLLGPFERTARKWLRKQLGDATQKSLTAFAVNAALGTDGVRDAVKAAIGGADPAAVDPERVEAAAGEVASLAQRFDRHELVIKVLAKALGWLRPKLVALASWAAAAVAGIYVLALGYGVWVAGDYLDWDRTDVGGGLDRVFGVRVTVLGALGSEA